MSKKPKKTAAGPRDPYWRARRALGAKRAPNARAYDRDRAKAADRADPEDPPEDPEEDPP